MLKSIPSFPLHFSLILLIHLGYFFFAWQFGVIYTEDSPEYLWMAQNLSEQAWLYSGDPALPIESKFLSMRPPIYGSLIAIVQLISKSVYAILVVQGLLSIFNQLLLIKLWQQYFAKVPSMLVVVALCLFPAHLIYTNMVMAELLFQSFFLLAFFYLLQYLKNRKERSYLWYQLFLLLALFTKPVLLYFWIPNLIFTCFLFRKKFQWKVLLMTMMLPLFSFLYANYNQERTGYFHFSSIKNINLMYFNARQVLNQVDGKATADAKVNAIRAEAEQMDDFKQQNEYLETQAKQIITDHIGTYAYIHLRGMLSFFLDPGRHDLVLFTGNQPQVEKRIGFMQALDQEGARGVWKYLQQIGGYWMLFFLLAGLWNGLLLFALLYFLLKQSLDLEIRIAVGLMILYVAFFSVTIGATRFRVEIYPILLFVLPFLPLKGRLKTAVF